jgi:Ca2+-transporting ATPase
LVVATAISAALWFFERETVLPYEALAIFAVILLNVLLGYVQRSRAEKAVAALVRMAAAHADVLRDGMLQCALVASSVLWLRELSKFALRKLG